MKKIFLLFFLICNSSYSIPSQIIIIRHAEKPENSDYLSARGQIRALALQVYFQTDPFVLDFGPPKAIFTFRPENPHYSFRGIQTMTPLAKQLDLKIHDQYKGEEFDALAKTVLQDKKYDNIPVLICWGHGKIPQLLNALGIPNIDEFSSKDFDLVFKITFDKDQKPHFCTGLQKLLYGDSSSLPQNFLKYSCN